MILQSGAINVRTMVYDNVFCSDSRKIGHHFEKEGRYLSCWTHQHEIQSSFRGRTRQSVHGIVLLTLHVPKHNMCIKSLSWPLCGEGSHKYESQGLSYFVLGDIYISASQNIDLDGIHQSMWGGEEGRGGEESTVWGKAHFHWTWAGCWACVLINIWHKSSPSQPKAKVPSFNWSSNLSVFDLLYSDTFNF